MPLKLRLAGAGVEAADGEPAPGASADPSLLGKGENKGSVSSLTPPSLTGKGAGG